jgi:uncharacterized RDD family membrane protein YckC
MAAVMLKWTGYRIVVSGRERGRPTNLLNLYVCVCVCVCVWSLFPKYAAAWLRNIMDYNLTMRVTTSATCKFSLLYTIIIILTIFFPYFMLGNVPDT